MIYEQIKSQIKTGDILGWTHRGWGSWYDFQIQMVRMFTRSEFSHVGIAIVENSEVYVLEAVGSGVRKKLLSEEVPFYWAQAEPLSEKALIFGLSQIGDKYESKIKMVLSFIFGFSLRGNARWQCSELVNAIKNIDGIVLTMKDEPSAIMEACWERYGEVKYVTLVEN